MPKEKNNNEIRTLATEILKNLHNNSIAITSDNKNLEEDDDLFTGLKEIEGLDEEIDKILALLQTREIDLSKLQTILILLINKYLSSTKSKQSKTAAKEIKNLISKEVAMASKLIIEQYQSLLLQHNNEIENEKNQLLSPNNFAKQQLKRLIKAFAVYEIYKVMTPRKIAGETKLDNFVHNVLSHHDVKYATRFAGGRQSDIASYSPSVKNTLKKQNIRNKDLLNR